MFMQLEDMFVSHDYPDVACLVRNSTVNNTIHLICEEKRSGEDRFYQFSKSKCIEWLRSRVTLIEEGECFFISLTASVTERVEGEGGGSASRGNSHDRSLCGRRALLRTLFRITVIPKAETSYIESSAVTWWRWSCPRHSRRSGKSQSSRRGSERSWRSLPRE